MKKETSAKNLLIALLVVLLCISTAIVVVVFVNGRSVIQNRDANITAIEGGTVESNVSLSVGQNETVDLPTTLAISSGATWELFSDENCQESLSQENGLELQDGENIFTLLSNLKTVLIQPSTHYVYLKGMM